jgi:hypothetical protein
MSNKFEQLLAEQLATRQEEATEKLKEKERQFEEERKNNISLRMAHIAALGGMRFKNICFRLHKTHANGAFISFCYL